jgi:aromatic ring hydroxylase
MVCGCLTACADKPDFKNLARKWIIVEGCKLHISEASVANEVLVLPTRALITEDKDYAVAFAVPGDWDGMKQVVTIHNFRPREFYKRGFVPGYTDSYLIFDNCFVPWE